MSSGARPSGAFAAPLTMAAGTAETGEAMSESTALVRRVCSPEWARLSFELVLAGRAPVNRKWQADVNRRMVELRARLGLR